MDPGTVQKRLIKAILAADMQASIRLEDDCRVNVGSLTIELFEDRLLISPGVTRLSAEQVKLLSDPESLLWLVVRLDDVDLEGKVARFLQKNRVDVRANWLAANQRNTKRAD